MPTIGLDLGLHNFRAIELEDKKKAIVLKNYGSYESPRMNLESNTEEDMKMYSESIKKFVHEIGFTTADVVVSLPESEVFTRVIEIPKMSAKDLKNAISYEAEQYIPLPLKEVNYDFQIIPDDESETKEKMEALIVAARNSILDKYVHILRNANLVPKGLEPETIAIQRVLSTFDTSSGASLIVDIGSKSTQLIIAYKGFVRFTRVVSVGGDSLTRAVEQELSLDTQQAEEYKRAYGLDQSQADGKVYNAIKPVFDNILMEIKRSKIFYTTHNPNVMIKKVILSGGSALMPGLLFYIANNLDVEVELANPWRAIQLPQNLESHKDTLMDHGPMYVTAVGLALKEVKNVPKY